MKKVQPIFLLFLIKILCKRGLKQIDTIKEENAKILNFVYDRLQFLLNYIKFLKEVVREALFLHVKILIEIRSFCYNFIMNVHTLLFSAFLIYLYHSLVTQIISNRCGLITKCQIQKYSEVRKKEESCSICINQLEMNDLVRVLPCEHIYHSKCIYNWIRKSLACPLCRKCIVDGYTYDHDVFLLF